MKSLDQFQIKTLENKYKINIISIESYDDRGLPVQRLFVIYKFPQEDKKIIASVVIDINQSMYERVEAALDKSLSG